jgi:hypothetical protein
MENKEFQFLLEVFSFNRGGTRTRNLRIFFFHLYFTAVARFVDIMQLIHYLVMTRKG